MPIIETRDVTKHFSAGPRWPGPGRQPTLKAVDGVSLAIQRGETLALVGETGSGKTTFGRLLLGLYRPTSGDIRYRGTSILDPQERGRAHGAPPGPGRVPGPVLVAEPDDDHRPVAGRGAQGAPRGGPRATGPTGWPNCSARSGLSAAQAARRRYAFSGGERQRVGIARALAVQPEVVIADEPLSALDVSIQAQVLNLMIRLQEERGLTYLFVTHDLDVARHISQRTAVLYLGRVVEQAPTEDIFAEPLHPYTQALVRAAPRLTTQRKTIKPALTGDIPNAIDRPVRLPLPPALPDGDAGVPGARAGR